MNPRKAIISVAIALAVLAAAGPLQAQVPFVPRAEFGVKAGINLSDINTDQLGSSTRSGFVGGVYLDLATALLHLQAEALLTQDTRSPRAEALLKEARTLSPECLFVLRAEAELARRQNRPEAARTLLEQALARAVKIAPEEVPDLKARLAR